MQDSISREKVVTCQRSNKSTDRPKAPCQMAFFAGYCKINAITWRYFHKMMALPSVVFCRKYFFPVTSKTMINVAPQNINKKKMFKNLRNLRSTC